MSCCSPAEGVTARTGETPDRTATQEEIRLVSLEAGDDLRQVELSVPDMHCGGCIRTIERGLGTLEGVADARANLTAKRVSVRWRGDNDPPPLIEALEKLGYRAHLLEPDDDEQGAAFRELVRAMAVAGFATGNIMLFSVSVWSGADADARHLFHSISALIALPTLAYSGRIFFRSAWAALRHGRTNMDVPISIGVLLAFALSLYDTINNGRHAYFDASVMLLFFLLVGRTLDHLMRERARAAVKGLARLAARGATVELSDGTREYVPVGAIVPGATIILAAGDRVPVDGRVVSGASDLDCSLVTGESLPRPVSSGSFLQAGTLNLTGPLRVEVTAAAKDSFLTEMVRLMEAAETGRSAYQRIADRASRAYAPVVHMLAFLSFAGWMVALGDVHQAVTIAVAVLIITCPCALGLAVPMVQVVATRRLFEQGIMVKDGSGLERLAEVDTVVFDKTGTLTMGQPNLRDREQLCPDSFAIAASLAACSRHPHSRAIVAAHENGPDIGNGLAFDTFIEVPGHGVEAFRGDDRYRLGRADWALADSGEVGRKTDHSRSILSRNGSLLADFAFDDPIRPGARETIAELKRRGLKVEMLSGDHPGPVTALGQELGIARAEPSVLPGEKMARLSELAAQGRKVLMVGDGLNDAPALASAHVSIAPASAVDVGRNAADFVFLRDNLKAITVALDVACRARVLVKQNLVLATVYNAIALPFAVLGYVTPLFAAVAMSSSSVIVIGNAMRLNAGTWKRNAKTRAGDRTALVSTVEATR